MDNLLDLKKMKLRVQHYIQKFKGETQVILGSKGSINQNRKRKKKDSLSCCVTVRTYHEFHLSVVETSSSLRSVGHDGQLSKSKARVSVLCVK